MAKTIIVPGADFSQNALAKVTFSAIPCLGVTLDQQSLSFSALGETKTLSYTLTPYNTTDTLSIVSSNTDIVTVNNNILTAVGIGTCAVTVTCGTASAVCAITSAIPADFMAVGKLRISHTGNNRSTLFTETASWIALGQNRANGYPIGVKSDGTEFVISDSINLCPIIIPKNTATIRVTAPYSGRFYWLFFDSAETQTYYPDAHSALPTKLAKYAYSTMYLGESVDIPFNSVAALGDAVVDLDGTDSIAIAYYNSANYKSMALGDIIPGFTVDFIPATEQGD